MKFVTQRRIMRSMARAYVVITRCLEPCPSVIGMWTDLFMGGWVGLI